MPSHASSEREHLHVVKASAGSGKTYRLTGEYLRLLFKNANAYKHTLAVTFTNKATEEMKSRIIKELFELSRDDSQSSFLSKLSTEFHLSDKQVQQKARTLLESILHDYSSFSISTIDRFFQQIMRSFAREMGLSATYNIELDDKAYLSLAIDSMLLELSQSENKDLTKWLLMLMKNNIENQKGWNVKQDIQRLGEEIFKEKYKLLSKEEKEKIQDKDELNKYRAELLEIKRKFESELIDLGNRGVKIMSDNDLDCEDFKYGKDSVSHFVKWANGEVKTPTKRFLNLGLGIDEWIKRGAPADKVEAIQHAYDNGLNQKVNEVLQHFEDNFIEYNSANAILKSFYTLGILSDIQKRLQQLQKDENIFFISDTTELLNKIINDSDAPFIYEKTGSWFKNYMMDEFQDTSDMQWANFRPLIQESLGGNQFNLIVGDIKQSIYRWRNSNWRLLNEQISKDFRSDQIHEETLSTNWRSDDNIVRFNNVFFATAAEKLQIQYNKATETASNKITQAYEGHQQEVPDNRKNNNGRVEIHFVDADDKEEPWKEKVLAELPKLIEQLQDNNYSLKDICILLRKKKEVKEVAETLLKYQKEHPDSPYRYDFISNEALVIGNAPSVKAAIALLRWLKNPNDDTHRTLALYEYFRFVEKEKSPRQIINMLTAEEDAAFIQSSIQKLESLAHLPLYEMAESFYALQNKSIGSEENIYIQAFLDVVLKFNTNQSSDLDAFLKWWDEKNDLTLSSPEEQDAIRMLTIHKSKGLEFKAVIMPFVDWDLDHSHRFKNYIWCQPQTNRFNKLPIVPVEYSPTLSESIFAKEYQEEKLLAFIDNFNLLYVAFTRAKSCLFAFAPQKESKSSEIKNVGDLLKASVQCLSQSNMIAQEDGESNIFSLGEIEKLATTSQNVQPTETATWQSNPFDSRLKLRLNSTGFFADNGKRDYGVLMHDILRHIETMNDVASAVDKKVLSGEISQNEKGHIVKQITDWLSLPEAAHWYDGSYAILNEMSLLVPHAGFYRPDRIMMRNDEIVVVDYKFGDVEEEKYIRQVKYYVNLIQKMDFSNVSGFVFYVKMKKIIRV